MAQQDCPNCKFRLFPRWSLWSVTLAEGGGASCDGVRHSNTSLLQLLLHPHPTLLVAVGSYGSGAAVRDTPQALYRMCWGRLVFLRHVAGGGGGRRLHGVMAFHREGYCPACPLLWAWPLSAVFCATTFAPSASACMDLCSCACDGCGASGPNLYVPCVLECVSWSA